jgi:hypothetical protein
MKDILYCLETGWLIQENDKEFDSCSQIYNNPKMKELFGYNANNRTAYCEKDFGQAIADAEKFVESNKGAVYAVITNQGACDYNRDSHGNIDCIEQFKPSSNIVEYSIACIDENIKRYFIDVWHDTSAVPECRFDTEEDMVHHGDAHDKIDLIRWRDTCKYSFVCEQLRFNPKASRTILQFIADFIYTHSMTYSHAELIRRQFHAGYCYQFAHMLQSTFKCGTVCVCGNIGHFVWCNVDEKYLYFNQSNIIAYDIDGVNETECEFYIPESFLSEKLINDFTHIPGRPSVSTKDDIEQMIAEFRKHRYT